jgi:hypothetical protein
VPSVLRDREVLATALLLAVVLVVGLATASDYGITTDEFLFDDYGPKALAWYTSGFTDRSQFDFYDLALYGPWFHILVALAQSLHLAAPFTVRHATTFVVGLAGIAALLPIGRLAVGRWAGFAAIVLCLTTGNLYGHLFFTPNDIPFLAAMTWATLAVVVMARRSVPTWPATIAAGLLSGLAIATRFGGLLAQAYLAAAMALCAIEVMVTPALARGRLLGAITARALVAIGLGWLAAAALWPWLQIGNPFTQFGAVYDYFIRSYVQFAFPAWGETLHSGALPWHYIPGQLLARLPEGFIALLAIALLLAVLNLVRLVDRSVAATRQNGAGSAILAATMWLTQARALALVAIAALAPPIFIVLRGSVVFDGIRHVLFVVPMLAILAAWALVALAPLLARFPLATGAAAAVHVATTVGIMIYLHPLEYVAMNAFAGGTAGAYGRFDLDYWSAAATEGVRRLEGRLAQDVRLRPAARTPRVMVCIAWREELVAPLNSGAWIMATKPRDADFLIETERSACGEGGSGTVIDKVERFHRVFATTVETKAGTDVGAVLERQAE